MTVDHHESPSLLQNRNFVLLWSAQAVTQTAQNAIFYGLIVFIESQTSSSVHVSFLILSAILPSLVFGVPAGIVVDRLSKKGVLVATNVLRAIAVLGYIAFGSTLGLIYTVNFFFSTISQFFLPAEAATIPLVVRRTQLISANGLFNLTFTISQLLGFVLLGPALVKATGPLVLFVLIAIAFAAGAALVSFLPDQEPAHPNLTTLTGQGVIGRAVSDLNAGLTPLRRDPVLSLAMIQLTLMTTLLMVIGMLAPGFVNRVLGIDAADAVYVLAPGGVGILVGIIALPRLADRSPKEMLINVGLVVIATALLLLGLAERGEAMTYRVLSFLPIGLTLPSVLSVVSAVMTLTFIIGLGFAMVTIPAQTVLQERVPDHLRGKVFATQFTLANVVAILPLLFLGALADIVGVSRVILLLGGIVLVIAVFSIRSVRKAADGKKGELTEPGAEVLLDQRRLSVHQPGHEPE